MIAAQAVTLQVEQAVRQFLGYEAMLLDNHRLDDWAALLDDQIVYEIPMRIAARGDISAEFPANSFRVRDDLAMIRKRIERFGTGQNWSEDPASRTVRNVGSVYVDATADAGVYRAHSALTVYRQRAIDRAYEWIPARRIDDIRLHESGNVVDFRLLRRTIILAEIILQTPNLGIFL